MNNTSLVIMPFTVREEHLGLYGDKLKHWSNVNNKLIKKSVEAAGFACHRADEDVFSGDLVRRLVKKIEKADIIICDLSTNNPNVLFELGWALRANRKVVFMIDDVTLKSFDLQHIFIFHYKCRLPPAMLESYQSTLAKCIRSTAAEGPDNPTIYEGWGMETGNKPVFIRQRCAVTMYYHHIGLTKKDAEEITDTLRKDGISVQMLEHDDKDGPDAVFIGSLVEAEDARAVLKLVPYQVKYLFRPDYPESEGGDNEGYRIGIGYTSKYNEGRRIARAEPVPISQGDFEELLNDHNNASFHRLIWKFINNYTALASGVKDD